MDYKKFGDSIYVRFNRGDEIISTDADTVMQIQHLKKQ